MIKLARFLAALLLMVWLGCVITLTFYVAPSLFKNASGVVPTSAMAGEIMGPLLRRMYRTTWVALPPAFCLICAVYAMARRGGRAAFAACLMLACAWSVDLIAGGVIQRRIHSIRTELTGQFGAYDKAPDDNPQRARFKKLHGASMALVMLNLGLGLGAFFCVTQLLPTGKGEGDAAPGAKS